MRGALLKRDQLMLALPGSAPAWQRLPAPAREAVIELVSRLLLEHVRRGRTAGRQERTNREREEEI